MEAKNFKDKEFLVEKFKALLQGKAVIVDLTKEVYNGMKVEPVIASFPPIVVKKFESLEKGDKCNGTMMSFPIHDLTHVDYPCHKFNNGGKTGKDFSLATYFGAAKVANNEEEIPREEIVLFHNRGINFSTAKKLVSLKKKIVGTDLPTIGKDKAHEHLLSNDVLIVENLTNLEKIEGKRVLFITLPLNVNVDGSPVRAIAVY